MGAADALPGQNASHEAEGHTGTPETDGTHDPDLQAVLGEAETEEGTPSGGEETPPKETERDALSGKANLSDEDRQAVEELKRRDQEVRTHEQAHVAAGGRHVRGGISYEYQSGPDGKRYAVGGEVSIDTSPESDPEATIRKAQTIRQAALAPAEPSGQDRKAAAAAAQMEIKARQEISEARLEGEGGGSGEVESVEDTSSTNRDQTDEKAVSDLLHGQTAQESGEAVGEILERGLPAAVSNVPEVSNNNEGGLEAAEGVSGGRNEDKGGLEAQGGVQVRETEKEAGLPEPSAPSFLPPSIKLDYGQRQHAGGLVDIYG
jgi:hypothetical protein